MGVDYAPGAGAVPQEKGSLIAGHENYTVTGLSWKDSDGTSPAVLTDGKFKAETVYKAVIELTAATGCKFQPCTPAVDAGTAEAGVINEDAIGNKLTFTVTFPATVAKIVTGI